MRETFELRGVTLRKDPAREECFNCVDFDAEMHEYADMSDVSRRERVHRHMNNELGGLDIAAECLADFPDAPWELRMQLARQCWDETRHIMALHRRLVEMGGHKGEFPVSNFEWRVTSMQDTLAARLALQNRTFEAGQMDILGKIISSWREAGDDRTAEMLEAILADEIQHVRFANEWIKRYVAEDPRTLMKIAVAIRYLQTVTQALGSKRGEINAVGVELRDVADRIPPVVNVEDRRLAGFSDAEINEVLQRTNLRGLVRQEGTR
jgi:bacterioferritin (cytochrome b1)